MKKTILKMIIVIIAFFSISVNAENINSERLNTVTIKYSYGDSNFDNKKVYLYKIADINSEGKFIYNEEFTN